MDEPVYDVEKAKFFIHSNLSPGLQAKLTPDDIEEIIELEFDFLENSGHTSDCPSIVDYPRQIDYEALYYFVIHEAVKGNLYITREELEEVLDAETEYLYEIGAIDPDDQVERFFN